MYSSERTGFSRVATVRHPCTLPSRVVVAAVLKIKHSTGSLVIKSLHLRGIRAHVDSTVRFDDGINVIVGSNGAGKTNILEAVHILCLSRSFLTSRDQYVLRKGSPFYEVEGEFESEVRSAIKVRAAFVPQEGKKVFVGGVQVERMADLVGQFPIVVFSPEDQQLTAEGPEHRRRFLDNIISQSSSLHLENLIRYRKVLKQRNELLLSARRSRRQPDPMLLESWSRELLETGSAIITDRVQFISKFGDHLENAHQKISAVAERPTLTYSPFPDETATTDNVLDLFGAQMQRRQDQEVERGVTLVGPHRHDVYMALDELPVRRYASQGQHRTFGMAMKLAQYDYLKEQTPEAPILLLDDVFDNLDPARIEAFLEILGSESIGQSITTAARQEIVHNHLDPSTCRTIYVHPGARVSDSGDRATDLDSIIDEVQESVIETDAVTREEEKLQSKEPSGVPEVEAQDV